MGDEGFQPLLFGDIVPVTYAFLRSDYFEEGFHFDNQIGTYTVNFPFLAAVLRLG